jgi:hypothetical protein
MNVVPVAGASLPGSMSIQNRVVISSRNAFPWTLDALRSSRLVSRQLKVTAKNWVRMRLLDRRIRINCLVDLDPVTSPDDRTRR